METTATLTPEEQKAATEKAEAEAAAAKAKDEAERAVAYARAMEDADLGIKQSTIEYNNAAKWAAWGIGVGAVSVGVAALVYAVRK